MAGRKSDRFVSMADVAKAAGVSQQTISRVANNSPKVSPETRAHVQAVMDEMGYRPSFAGRSLKNGSYHTVGLVMFNITSTGNLDRLDSILTAAAEDGYAITLIKMSPDEQPTLTAAAERMRALPVDGMIFNLNTMVEDFEEFCPLPGLTTVLTSPVEHPVCSSVDGDQLRCSRDAVEHLLAHGHKNVRFVTGKSTSLAARLRLQGWQETLLAHGIEPVEPIEGDWSADRGYEAGAILAKDPACTAVYAANDTTALGVITALRDAGRRVPEDVSVVGVDDSLVGVVPHAELTSVRFDNRKVGRLAFELAVNGSDKRQHTLVPGALVERQTVADAPQ